MGALEGIPIVVLVLVTLAAAGTAVVVVALAAPPRTSVFVVGEVVVVKSLTVTRTILVPDPFCPMYRYPLRSAVREMGFLRRPAAPLPLVVPVIPALPNTVVMLPAESRRKIDVPWSTKYMMPVLVIHTTAEGLLQVAESAGPSADPAVPVHASVVTT